MLELLKKYKKQGHFTFTGSDDLESVCNAPEDGAGVYLMFSVKKDVKELVYVGSSGSIQNSGEIKIRQGGIYDRLVHGKQFKLTRKKSLPIQMKKDNIDFLEIHWFETFADSDKGIPTCVEAELIQAHFNENSCLPKWNVAF